MHLTAMQNVKKFFDVYAPSFDDASAHIVEIGSQNVNGSIRDVAPNSFKYTGLDFVSGKGVDVVLTNPYQLPIESGSVDLVVCSSVFEHSQFFWLSFLEILRILKDNGIAYLNVPSNGHFHRYPVDCWRFYPDSGKALEAWAIHNGIQAVLLESYISLQDTSADQNEVWNDFVGVFLKSDKYLSLYPNRILEKHNKFINGVVSGSDEFFNKSEFTEDTKKLLTIRELTKGNLSVF